MNLNENIVNYQCESDYSLDIQEAHVLCYFIEKNAVYSAKASGLKRTKEQVQQIIMNKTALKMVDAQRNKITIIVLFYGPKSLSTVHLKNLQELLIPAVSTSEQRNQNSLMEKIDMIITNMEEFQQRTDSKLNEFTQCLNDVKVVCADLTKMVERLRADAMEVGSTPPRTESTPSSDGIRTQSSTNSSCVSYVPKGYIEEPKASGSRHYKHPLPIDRFVTNDPQKLKLAATQIIAASRNNSKWLNKLENFQLEGVDPEKMQQIRVAMKDGSAIPSHLARQVALILFSKDYIKNYLCGHGSDIRKKGKKSQANRNEMQREDTEKLIRIFTFFDEFFRRDVVFNTIVRDPVNQLGRELKTKNQ